MPKHVRRRDPRQRATRSQPAVGRRLAGAAILSVAIATTVVVSLGSGEPSSRSSAAGPHGWQHRPHRPLRARRDETRTQISSRARREKRPRRPRPGSLPQTEARPTARTVAFRREMSALWTAIVKNHPARGTKAFFPKGAYLQLKAIEGASADYSNRLFHDYALDIHAAHSLLGADASSARLVRVEVPPSYAHWIPPNVCYNRVGYWETPNSRIVYREHRHLRSFGIASLISWRGVWYVVHLGAILRAGDEGVVDAPAAGIGVPEPSSTC